MAYSLKEWTQDGWTEVEARFALLDHHTSFTATLARLDAENSIVCPRNWSGLGLGLGLGLEREYGETTVQKLRNRYQDDLKQNPLQWLYDIAKEADASANIRSKVFKHLPRGANNLWVLVDRLIPVVQVCLTDDSTETQINKHLLQFRDEEIARCLHVLFPDYDVPFFRRYASGFGDAGTKSPYAVAREYAAGTASDTTVRGDLLKAAANMNEMEMMEMMETKARVSAAMRRHVGTLMRSRQPIDIDAFKFLHPKSSYSQYVRKVLSTPLWPKPPNSKDDTVLGCRVVTMTPNFATLIVKYLQKHADKNFLNENGFQEGHSRIVKRVGFDALLNWYMQLRSLNPTGCLTKSDAQKYALQGQSIAVSPVGHGKIPDDPLTLMPFDVMDFFIIQRFAALQSWRPIDGIGCSRQVQSTHQRRQGVMKRLELAAPRGNKQLGFPKLGDEEEEEDDMTGRFRIDSRLSENEEDDDDSIQYYTGPRLLQDSDDDNGEDDTFNYHYQMAPILRLQRKQ